MERLGFLQGERGSGQERGAQARGRAKARGARRGLGGRAMGGGGRDCVWVLWGRGGGREVEVRT